MGAFFDRLERTELTKRLAVRGADGARLRLIGQGLPVGVLDGEADGEPAVGPVQGAVLSPWLGNVSLHSGRDRWCETEVKPRLGGKATLIRSGDDFLSGFAREDEARRVLAVLGKRFGRCGLIRPPDTPRRLPGGRPPQEPHSGTGLATFDFLGFTFSGARSRQGRWGMGCKTRRASLRRAQTAIDDWCRRHRHQPMAAQPAALGQRWRGHYTSFGVSGNVRRVLRVVEATKRAWYTWWCRRSQRKRLHWKRFVDLLQQFPLPRPRMVVRIWGIEPRATSTEEPDGGNLLVRIWRGAGTGNRPAYSTTAFSTTCVRPPRATLLVPRQGVPFSPRATGSPPPGVNFG
jgi:RNA-directed DNA polymerase